MSTEGVKVVAHMNKDTAWELAQFLKRVTLSTCRELARNDDEAYRMMEGIGQLQEGFKKAATRQIIPQSS